jgi:hypothetical protein
MKRIRSIAAQQLRDIESDKRAMKNQKRGSKRAKTAESSTLEDHKKVNHRSANRRQCNRIVQGQTTEGGKDDDSNSTQGRNNNMRTFNHTYVTRVTLKLFIPASKEPARTTSELIKELVNEIIKIDDKAAIYPWKDALAYKGRITSGNEVPECRSDFSDLRAYLHKFFPPKKDTVSTSYPNLRIGHEKPIEEIRKELRPWLETSKSSIFKNMLQVEEGSEIGWFCYSTREMDAGALADEISDILGINIGLRWKIINIGQKGIIPQSQKVNALAIEVDSKSRRLGQKKFLEFFGRKAKPVHLCPNNIRLRFVKSKSDAINTREKGKIDRLRTRQKKFLDSIVSTTNWDIMQLDFATDEGSPTLRQMIMSITSKVDDNVPLFHCVDLDWRGDGYTFQYSPDVKDEAECVINTLIPHLKFRFPLEDVDSYFTSEAVENSEGLVYDGNRKEVIDTYTDNQDEQGVEIDDEDGLIGFNFTEGNTNILPPDEMRPIMLETPKRKHFPNSDGDSVSTLGNPINRSNFSSSFKPSPAQTGRRNADDQSVISSGSSLTVETIATEMNTRFSIMERTVQESNAKFDQIIGMLNSRNNEGNSNTLGKDGTPTSGSITTGETMTQSSGDVSH